MPQRVIRETSQWIARQIGGLGDQACKRRARCDSARDTDAPASRHARFHLDVARQPDGTADADQQSAQQDRIGQGAKRKP